MNERRQEILEELQRVKYVGASVAEQLYEELTIRDVEDLVEAAENGWLQNLSGIGATRESNILESARSVIEEVEAERREAAPSGGSPEEQAGEVSVTEVSRAEPPEREAETEAEPTAGAGSEEAEQTAEEGRSRPRPRIDRFIERLRCPACGHDTFDRGQSTLQCTACRRTYNVHAGVADLAPPDLKTGGLAQRVMESKIYSRLYENIMRPGLTSLVSRRSMEEEKTLAAQLLDLDAESTVLDVACGTGNFSRHFAERIAAATPGYNGTSLVVGIDISWPMLERAREYVRRDGLNDRIFLVRGDATRMPVGRETFNRLHCAGALHLMEDIDEALRNFARVLEPGGIAVIGTFLARGNAVIRTLKRLGEIPTKFHWFDRDELHQRLERAGFEVAEESISDDAITVKAVRR